MDFKNLLRIGKHSTFQQSVQGESNAAMGKVNTSGPEKPYSELSIFGAFVKLAFQQKGGFLFYTE